MKKNEFGIYNPNVDRKVQPCSSHSTIPFSSPFLGGSRIKISVLSKLDLSNTKTSPWINRTLEMEFKAAFLVANWIDCLLSSRPITSLAIEAMGREIVPTPQYASITLVILFSLVSQERIIKTIFSACGVLIWKKVVESSLFLDL